MTLAEMRELLTGELALRALAGGNSLGRLALLLRLGRPLVRRHVQPRQRLLWSGTFHLVERTEHDSILFHQPRMVVTMAQFLESLVRGRVRDA